MKNLLTTDIKIQQCLSEAIQTLFPFEKNPSSIIKPHTWRDQKYLGIADGKVVSWKGWSANLTSIDSQYRVIFADIVENTLSVEERVRLFGEEFANAISNFPEFVVLFVLDFPRTMEAEVQNQGFVPRIMGRTIHACVVASLEEFSTFSSLHWAAKIVRLVNFQRLTSIHRKPTDSNEIRLQHLLYNSGYLHSYIVKSGLGLHELSQPRRAGGFGHDFHALVTNPSMKVYDPFPIGIELYMGTMGYHIETIPSYINTYNLRGMIVIAKDNPFFQGQFNSQKPIMEAKSLSMFGTTDYTVVYHLSLSDVITELDRLSKEIANANLA